MRLVDSWSTKDIKKIFCDELSATNCPRWVVRDELSCDELSCDELSATNCPVTELEMPVYTKYAEGGTHTSMHVSMPSCMWVYALAFMYACMHSWFAYMGTHANTCILIHICQCALHLSMCIAFVQLCILMLARVYSMHGSLGLRILCFYVSRPMLICVHICVGI